MPKSDSNSPKIPKLPPFPNSPKSEQQKLGAVRSFIQAIYNIQISQKYKDDNDSSKLAPKMSKSDSNSPKTPKSEPNSANFVQETPNSKSQQSKSASRPTAVQIPEDVLQMFHGNHYESRKIRIPDTFLSRSSLLSLTDSNDRAEFEAKVVNGCEKIVPKKVAKRVSCICSSIKYPDYGSLKTSETKVEAEIEIEACNFK